MSKVLKFRAWDEKNKQFADYEDIEECLSCQNRDGWKSSDGMGCCFGINAVEILADCIIEQYTGLKDKNGDKEIYEYDIIDGEGNIIGNYHETPELLKDKTNLLIQGFGTKTWLTTYQKAVERGCHDA